MATGKEQTSAEEHPVTSGENDLALYWDSRYHRYFYAGAMTPPTGQLYDLAGTPITHPTDIHTWSVVELEQGECPVGRAGGSSSRSIITPRDQMVRKKLL
ncbi:hypothetical protein V5799_011741 [Amblyomma americanum]|uniref:Uncharacterized protein n=1 Tax=Amblyomma americanum TaxID=6943 RepID=A0AAQ4EG99_AMBAM